MLTHQQLQRLNRIWTEKTGYAVNGGPLFRFMRSSELMFPFKTGTTIREGPVPMVVPTFELAPQFDGPETWVIARWVAPPYRADWERDYPQMDYPENGYWFMVVPLKPGHDPDEDWTLWAADHMNWQREMTYRQTVDLIESKHARLNAQKDEEMRDMVKECFVNHVPGKAGGDFLAFNAPAESTGEATQ